MSRRPSLWVSAEGSTRLSIELTEESRLPPEGLQLSTKTKRPLHATIGKVKTVESWLQACQRTIPLPLPGMALHKGEEVINIAGGHPTKVKRPLYSTPSV